MITEYCQAIFDQSAFMQTLGAKLLHAHAGVCEIEIALDPKLTQQDGFAHAGVQASIADHACGVATASLIELPKRPLSIEFKINLLRPASGETLLAHAHVLRCGKTISVVECEVFARKGETTTLTAKMVATIAVVS